MKRNEISNLSNGVGIGGSTIIVAIGIGIFEAVHVNSSIQNNSRGLSAFIAFGAAMGLALALPWFVLEKRRPGLSRPENTNIVQAGLWQVYRTGKDIWKLKQSLIYLISETSSFHLSTDLSVIVHSIFPPRRRPEYDRDRCDHSPDRSSGLRQPHSYLPLSPHCSHSSLRCLCLLVRSTQI